MKSIRLKPKTKERLQRMRRELTIINFEKFTYDMTVAFLLDIMEAKLKEASIYE